MVEPVRGAGGVVGGVVWPYIKAATKSSERVNMILRIVLIWKNKNSLGYSLNLPLSTLMADVVNTENQKTTLK